jgi:hypothetical protein
MKVVIKYLEKLNSDMPSVDAIDIIAKLRGADFAAKTYHKRTVSNYEDLAKKKLSDRKKSDRELAQKITQLGDSGSSTQGDSEGSSQSLAEEGSGSSTRSDVIASPLPTSKSTSILSFERDLRSSRKGVERPKTTIDEILEDIPMSKKTSVGSREKSISRTSSASETVAGATRKISSSHSESTAATRTSQDSKNVGPAEPANSNSAGSSSDSKSSGSPSDSKSAGSHAPAEVFRPFERKGSKASSRVRGLSKDLSRDREDSSKGLDRSGERQSDAPIRAITPNIESQNDRH